MLRTPESTGKIRQVAMGMCPCEGLLQRLVSVFDNSALRAAPWQIKFLTFSNSGYHGILVAEDDLTFRQWLPQT